VPSRPRKFPSTLSPRFQRVVPIPLVCVQTLTPSRFSYLELYASTQSGLGAFFGNRSIVIHTSNATRLTCANFSLTGGNANSTASPTSSGKGPVYSGGAVAKSLSFGAAFAGLAAFLL